MARIVIAGEAVVVTSSMKMEDLRKIAKYRPDALVLRGNDDEPIFKVGITCGPGRISQNSIEFGGETNDEVKLATLTLVNNGAEGDVRKAVADAIGAPILNLNKIEATLPSVLEEIDTEQEQILSNIVVVQ